LTEATELRALGDRGVGQHHAVDADRDHRDDRRDQEQREHVGDEQRGDVGGGQDAEILHHTDVGRDRPALLGGDLIGDGGQQRSQDGVAGDLREAPPDQQDGDGRREGHHQLRDHEEDQADDHPGAAAPEARGGQVAEPPEDRIRHQGEESGDRQDRGVGHGGRAGVAVEQGLRLQRQAHRDRGQQGDEQTELGDGHGDHDPGRCPVGRHGPVAADGGI
jgi:hypothetical protein